MPGKERHCCDVCGRDTTSASHVCYRCVARDRNGYRGTAEKGRTRFVTQAQSPIDDVDDDPTDPLDHTYNDYHGGSIRDDI